MRTITLKKPTLNVSSMKLILLRESDGGSVSLKIGPRAYALAALVLLAIILGTAHFVATLHELSPGQQSLIDDWQTQMQVQREEVAALRNAADHRSGAVGQRLAEMQARMLRMEALGERVTQVANISSDEFSFGQPVALGGPEAQMSVGSGFADFNLALDDMGQMLERQERQLRVLQSVLVDDQIKDASAVKGRPVLWGWVSSPYGRRVDPFSGKMGWHAGVDFAGKEDSDVVAVASGVVVYSGKRSGFGRLIEINHGDGYVTRYAHHKESKVGTGDVVKKGDQIAVMGSTGRSTGPHVHFEVLKNGRHQDPEKFVRRRS